LLALHPRTGIQGRFILNDLPPWYTVYKWTQRWVKAGVFEEMVRDLRIVPREIEGCYSQLSDAIFDGRTFKVHLVVNNKGQQWRTRWHVFHNASLSSLIPTGQ
jgi:transposase